MATSSQAKATETAIVTILGAVSGLAGIQIERGHPGKDLERESIWTDHLAWGEWAQALGEGKRDSNVEVHIVVRVQAEGNDKSGTRDRSLDLANHVDEALRLNGNLSGAVMLGGLKSGDADSWVESGAVVCAVRLEAVYRVRKF